MRRFSDLYEAPQTLVFAFGRFNPPTTGHEKLIDKVASVAGGNPYRVYPSFTTNPKKDPLPHALKVAYMRKMFPKHRKNIIADKKMKTAIFIAEAVYKEGFKNLIMVVGSDRVKEFTEILNRYNDAPDKKGNQLFKFDSVKVVSAGERDPDAEGVEGMSASKMRAAAANGDKDAFLTGLPKGFKDGEKLYRDVRKYMGIREERDMGDMTDFETVRDMYLTGKIWNAGDIVEANGYTGEVVRKGTNYLSFVDEDGKVHKAWLHEITLDEEKVPNDDLNFVKTGGQFGKKRRFPTFIVKKEGIKYKAYDEQNNMEIKAASNSLEGLAKMLKPYIEKRTGSWKFEEVELDERNYRKEYDNYQGRPEQIARRSSRNQARRIMGDRTKIGMDVGHKDNDPLNNDPENLRNEDPSKNRREPRLREMDEDIFDTVPWLGKAKNYLFTKTHKQGLNKVALAVATEYAKQKKAGKTPKTMQIIHDISKNISDVTDRMARDYVNDLVKQGKLPKELKAEYEPTHETMSFKDFVNQIQINEVKQDSDVKDKKGTQPAKYYAGDMAKSTKDKRDAHFRKKKSGPAPGDADAKTKPSVHTKKFKQMYGEKIELDENEGLKNKAKKSGMPYSILKKVYDRGMAAWKTGHRPGTTPQQWAMARVNSFVTKSSGTWGGADKDLAKQVEMVERLEEDGPCWDTHKQVGMKKKSGKMVPNCVPKNEDLNEWGEITEKDDKSGKELNNPTKGDVKKYKVYVRNKKGNVVKVEFGDPNMSIQRDDPEARKNFRARHNCDQKKDKTTAGYWSCKFWSTKSVTDLMKG